MVKCSQIINNELRSNYWCASEYNSNNAWNFNGNNGTLNNNNKFNSLGVRSALDLITMEDNFDSFVAFYAEMIDVYKVARRAKRNKISQLLFEHDLAFNLFMLCYDVYFFQYIPKRSICFVILKPAVREVMAADFSDRIVQTFLVLKIQPILEQYLHDDSFSCRVGKGTLRAVWQLAKYVRQVTDIYRRDAYIYKMDIKGFFSSIDTNLYANKLIDFIQNNYKGDYKDMLMYLTRIIFQSLPQENCILKGYRQLREYLPKEKTLIGRTDGIGIPIGNRTSQMMCNFTTTALLTLLSDCGCKFAHYSDDNAGVVRNKEEFLIIKKNVEVFAREEMNMQIHPNKFYFQHFSKGVNFLSFKLKRDRMLPSNRIVHNVRCRIATEISKAKNIPNYIYKNKEHFMQTVNSYMGLLKHSCSYNIRKELFKAMSLSPWCIVFNFAKDFSKVEIKDNYKIANIHKNINKQRKHELCKRDSTTECEKTRG